MVDVLIPTFGKHRADRIVVRVYEMLKEVCDGKAPQMAEMLRGQLDLKKDQNKVQLDSERVERKAGAKCGVRPTLRFMIAQAQLDQLEQEYQLTDLAEELFNHVGTDQTAEDTTTNDVRTDQIAEDTTSAIKPRRGSLVSFLLKKMERHLGHLKELEFGENQSKEKVELKPLHRMYLKRCKKRYDSYISQLEAEQIAKERKQQVVDFRWIVMFCVGFTFATIIFGYKAIIASRKSMSSVVARLFTEQQLFIFEELFDVIQGHANAIVVEIIFTVLAIASVSWLGMFLDKKREFGEGLGGCPCLLIKSSVSFAKDLLIRYRTFFACALVIYLRCAISQLSGICESSDLDGFGGSKTSIDAVATSAFRVIVVMFASC